MLHYEHREGYERAGLYIQCRPVSRDYLQPGSYLQTDQGQMMSPLMVDLADLYPWIRTLGWTVVKGTSCWRGGLIYERKQLDVPDACYLGQTDAALAAYDEAWPSLMERFMGDSGQMLAADMIETKLEAAIGEAYARDTADRNPPEIARRVIAGRIGPHSESYLRRAVREWRRTPEAQRGLWFLFTCETPTCPRVGRMVGSGRLEASGPRACPACHELTTYRGRSNG